MRKESPQKTEHGHFSAGSARQALAALRRSRSGALLVTSGHRDVRLVVEARRVSVEGAGLDLDGAEDDAWEISRQFLSALFWGEATYFLDLQGKPMSDAPALRANAVPDKAIDLLDEGFRELTELRSLVPGVDVLVSRKGTPPPPDARSCAAVLYRALTNQPRHLGSAAKEAGLDPLDAAWAVSDLLEAEAAQIKRPAPTMAVRRLKSAEPVIREGLSPGVRALHLARGYSRSEPRRAAHFLQEAGLAFLRSNQGVEALEMFKQSHEQAPKDLGGLEGMVRALEVVGQKDEARRIREDLVDLYRSWNLPSRTLEHLDALAPLSVEQDLSKLDCLLTRRDFKGALEQARRVFPKLSAGDRIVLARRFGQSGAPKEIRAEAVGLSGAQRLRWPRRVLVLACWILVVGILGLSAEFYARIEFRRAASQTRLALTDLEPRRAGGAPVASGAKLLEPWADLERIRSQAAAVADRLPEGAVLREVPPVLAELQAIQDDAGLLQTAEVREALQWQRFDSVRRAKEALDALGATARSAALKRRVALELSQLAAYVEEVDGEIQAFANKSQALTKLQAGQALLRDHANARERFADKSVVIEIEVLPGARSKATWQVEGQAVVSLTPAGPGNFQANLPLRPGARGILRVSSSDMVPRQLTFDIDTLENPEVVIELIRCVPLSARIERPKVGPEQGLVVLDEPFDPKSFPREVPEILSSAKVLAPLQDYLQADERLIVQTFHATRSSGGSRGTMPHVFLRGIRVWLTQGKQAGRGYGIDLSQGGDPGLRRRVVRRSGAWVLPALDSMERFEEFIPAIKYALKREREVLK